MIAFKFGPALMGAPKVTDDKAKEVREALTKGVETLAAFLKFNGGPYLAGEHFTVGDINSWAYLQDAIQEGYFTLDGFPCVQAWFDKVNEQPGCQRYIQALEEEGFF